VVIYQLPRTTDISNSTLYTLLEKNLYLITMAAMASLAQQMDIDDAAIDEGLYSRQL